MSKAAAEWSPPLWWPQSPLTTGVYPTFASCLSSHFCSLLFLLSSQRLLRWPMLSWRGKFLCSATARAQGLSPWPSCQIPSKPYGVLLPLFCHRWEQEEEGQGCGLVGRKECCPRRLLVPLLMQPSSPPWATQGLGAVVSEELGSKFPEILSFQDM